MIYTVLLISIVSLLGTNASKDNLKLPSSMVTKLKGVDAQCVKDLGAPADNLQKILPWKLANNEENQKYLYCICNTLQLAKDNGSFDVDRVTNIFAGSNKVDEIKKLVIDCNAQSGKDKYETAYKIIDCFFGKSPIEVTL